jgi:uncharacterized membrane protein YfcA
LQNLTISIRFVEMPELLIVFLAGFAASFVDGALGMGFGPTSSSILLGAGIPPAGVSTMVNLAKVATGLTAAVAHWRFENIDHRLVLRLAVPGMIGALAGVTILNTVDGDQLKPVLSVLLLLVGVRILMRFSRPLGNGTTDADDVEGLRTVEGRGTVAAGAAGGVTNGLVGAWGPVVTPYLLHRGLSPRFAIGSVNTAEVAVAVVAAGSLLGSIGGAGVNVPMVLAMLAGGVLAAPAAAWSIRFVPARGLGIAVAALLLVTNLRELVPGGWRWLAYGVALAACAAAGVTRGSWQNTRAGSGVLPATSSNAA